jgi:diphosphomevalonate decarboxylase
LKQSLPGPAATHTKTMSTLRNQNELSATATAHPNIALVKYWGKRDERRILPFQSSVSVTLAPLAVTTSVSFLTKGKADQVFINGAAAQGSERQRVLDIVNVVRQASKRRLGLVRVDSSGSFPKAAGLASSAAAFAALSLAVRSAAGLARDVRQESILARLGSGSASRSIQGGFCRWNRGKKNDGSDSFAQQLFDESHWPTLRLLVCMVSRSEKEVKSRDGMRSTVETSPYYAAWVSDAEREAKAIVPLIGRRDLQAVGELSERNAWRMHATAFAANPPLSYFKPQTLELISELAALRKKGVGAWFTLDAGPNPVLLTDAASEARVIAWAKKSGADEVVRCHPGGDATVG